MTNIDQNLQMNDLLKCSNEERENTFSTRASIASTCEERLDPTIDISRPLSRSSMQSGLSITATKDGVEGKRVLRCGIPAYPLNLITTMNQNYTAAANRTHSTEQSNMSSTDAEGNVEMPDSCSEFSSPYLSAPANVPTGPPVTIREKMKLLSTGKLNKSGTFFEYETRADSFASRMTLDSASRAASDDNASVDEYEQFIEHEIRRNMEIEQNSNK